jgi:hypothetical protein
VGVGEWSSFRKDIRGNRVLGTVANFIVRKFSYRGVEDYAQCVH